MDLQVYGIIFIVILVSLLSLLFIQKFLPRAKTFDEMLAEKKKMREVILGTTVKPVEKKQKPKKQVVKKKERSPNIREQPIKETSNEEESEAESQVEFIQTEPFQVSENKKSGKVQQPKKNKGKSGILVNKSEVVQPVKEHVILETNHFEESQPKDAVEIQRQMKDDTDAARTKNLFRESKKPKAKVTPPVSPKNVPAKEDEEFMQSRKKRDTFATNNVIGEEAEINQIIRSLSGSELTRNQIQLLIDFLLNKQSDTITQDPSEWSEGKTDVVAKLKKQLQEKESQLKNEQDAVFGIQAKLKEMRNEINAEKMQYNSTMKAHVEELNNRKMELRTLNQEIQYLTDKHTVEKQTLGAQFQQLQAKWLQLSKDNVNSQESVQKIQQLNESNKILQQELANKTQQFLELQQYVNGKIKDEDESQQKMVDYEKKISEYEIHLNKKDESRLLIENELRQKVQEFSTRDTEFQKLQNELIRLHEVEKSLAANERELNEKLAAQQQNNHVDENNKIEIKNLQNALDSSKKEQEGQKGLVTELKKTVDELNKQLAENSKQNSLKKNENDSAATDKITALVATHKTDLLAKEAKISECQKQIEDLRAAQVELNKQIEEQKTKNNDLRTKNWKLVDALQVAQSAVTTAKPTTNDKSENNQNSVVSASQPSVDTTQLIAVEQAKTKDLLLKHFPDLSSSTAGDHHSWLDKALEAVKATTTNHLSTNNFNSSSNSDKVANHVTNNGNCVATPSNAESEVLLLQNAQLQTTVDEYKTIVADTESLLKNLEAKVREQDAYWRNVVQFKDDEISSFKAETEAS